MSLTKPIRDLIVDTMLDVWESADKWTQGVVARSRDGGDVSADSPWAISWCAVGCKNKALHDLGLMQYDAEFEEFMNYYTQQEFGRSSIVHYNDSESTTFEDMRLFVKCLKDKDLISVPDDTGVCTCPDCQDDETYLGEEECDDSYL